MIRSTLLLVVAAAISGADAFAPVGMSVRANTQLFMVSSRLICSMYIIRKIYVLNAQVESGVEVLLIGRLR